MSTILAGFGFPFRIVRQQPSGLGGFARASGTDKIAQDLQHLLGTRLGERTMLRSYGGGAQALLQEPNNGTVRALFKHDVERALALFLPEARLVSPITVFADEEAVRVSIQYIAPPDQVLQRLALTFPA